MRALELTLPPAGVIRSHSSSSSSSNIQLESNSQSETPSAPASVIRVKEEPLDPESRIEEAGRDERKEREEEMMKEVKSEQNAESMTETDV